MLLVNGTPIAPDGTHARNWAFDVTPSRLIDGYLTDRGDSSPQSSPSWATATMGEQEARVELTGVALRLVEDGLNHDATGNLSVRIDGGILVTPTGIPAHDLRPEDCVALSSEGTPRDPSGRLPTSEWRLHVALDRRPGTAAVVHTHSPEQRPRRSSAA